MGFTLPWNRRDLTNVWHWWRDLAVFFDIFGWWANNYIGSPYYWWFRAIRWIFVGLNFSFIVSLTLGVVETMMSTSNMIDNLFSFFSASPGYLGLSKIMCITFNRTKIMTVWSTLDELMADAVKYQMDDRLLLEVRKRLKRCWLINIFLLVSGFCISIDWGLRPLLSAFFGDKIVLLDTWPKYTDTWFQWAVTYVFQASNIFSIAHGLHMYDNMYFCTSEHLLIHFTILKHHLHDLNLSKEIPGDVDLKFCSDYHKKLINACIVWRDATTSGILAQIIMSVLIMCPGVFEIVSGRIEEWSTLFNLLEIVVNVGAVLYLYCWYSNEVTYETSNMYKACYFTDWEKGNTSQRKSLTIMMARSMKPVVFGGIVRIDLETYITVWKTIFSYYQFLDTVNKAVKKT